MVNCIGRKWVYKKYNDEYFITYRYSEEEHDIMAKNIFENWVEEYGDINLMNYIQENGKQISEILKEKVDPVGILYPEGSNKYTKALYVTSSVAKVINQYYCSFISEYTKRNTGRKIRILEIGAGTAATALPIIDTLKIQIMNIILLILQNIFAESEKTI